MGARAHGRQAGGARLGAAAALLLATAGAGCGYRFIGPGGQLPGGVRSVCAPMLANLTAQPAAQTVFSRSLSAAVAERGLSRAGASCDATLEGALVSLSYGTGLLGPDNVPTFRVDASLRLTLRKGDAVLGAVQVSRSEDLLNEADVLAAEANFEAALQRLADDLARDAMAQLAASAE